jgi:hypothetical protein
MRPRVNLNTVAVLSVLVLTAALISHGRNPARVASAQAAPSWGVSFVDAIDPINVGSTESWTLTATNTLASAATDGTVTATATLTGFSPVSASGTGWTCSVTGPSSISCSRGDSLAPSASFPPITITGTAATCGTNSTSASVSGGGPSAGSATSSTTVTCTSLGVTKTDAVDPIVVGQTESWSVVVSNTGPGLTSGTVTVTDAIPSAFTTVAATGSGWVCSVTGNNVSCTRSDTLPARSAYPAITITAVAAACSPANPTLSFSVVNTATAAGGSATSSASGSSTTTVVCPSPTLAVTKSDALDPIITGQVETWSVVVSNSPTPSAPGPTSGTVTVTDPVPFDFAGVSAAGQGWNCGVQGNTVQCTRGDSLASGSSYPPILIRATALTCGGVVTNTATASGGGAASSASGSAATTILCRQQPIPVTDITVTATPTRPPSPPATQAPTQPPTATATAPATATATPPPTATATLPATQPPTATATPPPTATATPPITQPMGQPEGVRFQSGRYISGANPLRVGQPTRIEVTYALTNTANERVDYAATVLFDLADGVTAVAATPTKGTATIAQRQVSWGGFALDPNETATITMSLDVTPSAAAQGRAVTLITGTTTTGRTASGGLVNVRGGELTSAAISGLANGGLVLGPLSAGPGPALPRTGSGGRTGGDRGGWLAPAGLLAALALGLFPAAARRYRRRTR